MRFKNLIQSILIVVLLIGTSCTRSEPFVGKSVPELIVALQAAESTDRENAANALGKKGADAESAIPALVEVLFDPEEDVRIAARDALVEIGPNAVKPLFDTCKRAIHESYSDEIVSPICDGLDQFEANSIPVFVEIYNTSTIGSTERYSVVSSFSSMVDRLGIGAIDTAPTLVSALGDPWTQINAADTLVKLGKAAVPDLITGLLKSESSVRYQSAVVLGRIGPDAFEAGPSLVLVLDDPVPDVRAAAVLALEKIGYPFEYSPSHSQRIDDLIVALNHSNPEIRAATAEALGNMGAEAEAALPALVFAKENDPDPAVREAVETAIQKIRTALNSG